ncbi:hypothetical protein FRC00_003362, partial [Tulasnella sp. 408]
DTVKGLQEPMIGQNTTLLSSNQITTPTVPVSRPEQLPREERTVTPQHPLMMAVSTYGIPAPSIPLEMKTAFSRWIGSFYAPPDGQRPIVTKCEPNPIHQECRGIRSSQRQRAVGGIELGENSRLMKGVFINMLQIFDESLSKKPLDNWRGSDQDGCICVVLAIPPNWLALRTLDPRDPGGRRIGDDIHQSVHRHQEKENQTEDTRKVSRSPRERGASPFEIRDHCNPS